MYNRSALIKYGAALAPLALTTSLLAACADSDSSASGSTEGCGPDLKYGILTAFTGELGEFGKTSKNGFDIAFNEMTSSGALPEGWKISEVVADEKADIQVGLRAATDMMQRDKVSAILGPSSGPIVAMASVAKRYKTPIISQFAGTTNFSKVGGEYLFRTVASDASDGEATAQYLREKKAENVAIVVQNDQSTITAGEAAAERFEAAGGTVVDTFKYNPGQPSYQAVVQKALKADADAIYLAGGQESAITILKEMRGLGVESSKLIVSADLVVPDVISAVGKDWAEGLAGVTAKADTERPEYTKFAEAYQAEYDEEPGIFVENAYDAAILVGLAAVSAKSTCAAAIAEALPEISAPDGTDVTSFADGAKALANGDKINYEGASGPVDFDETGTVVGSYAVYNVEGGEWSVVKFYPADTFAK